MIRAVNLELDYFIFFQASNLALGHSVESTVRSSL